MEDYERVVQKLYDAGIDLAEFIAALEDIWREDFDLNTEVPKLIYLFKTCPGLAEAAMKLFRREEARA
jgi:hypothetical protein